MKPPSESLSPWLLSPSNAAAVPPPGDSGGPKARSDFGGRNQRLVSSGFHPREGMSMAGTTNKKEKITLKPSGIPDALPTGVVGSTVSAVNPSPKTTKQNPTEQRR
jgi:hypothetical protein